MSAATMRLCDFDAVIFDMDGTIYHDAHALPGAAQTIALLQQMHKPFACLTNASANTAAELSQRLQTLGMNVPPSSIYTAGRAMAQFMLERWPQPRVCNWAGRSMIDELGPTARFVTRIDEPCDVVAVATHMRADNVGFDMDLALVALEHLRRSVPMVVGCADRVFPIAGGGVEFGSGSWAALFAYGAAMPPERVHYMGKPEKAFFLQLCRNLQVDPTRCLLVGDNLESDIRGGLGVGMTTALLYSGVTTRAASQLSPIKPHLTFDHLQALFDAMQ